MKTAPAFQTSPPARRTSTRTRSSRQVVFLAVAALAIAACSGRALEDQGDLDAILRDGDLTQLSRHALTLAASTTPTVNSGTATGTGGAAARGSGGTTAATGGSSGSVDGGVGASGGTAAGGSTVSVDGGSDDGAGGTAGGSTGEGGSGMAGKGGAGGSGLPFPQSGQGLWQFDDCSAARTDLFDSSFNSHTAFRSVSTACSEGRQGQGVTIDGPDDYVYVPDQPNFTFDSGITVAAWVKPAHLDDLRTIIRKREDGTSTFVLASNGRSYQFVIRLANGRAASVRAPATLNVWTHVAATYDGSELRLYLNGVLAAHTRANGLLSNGAGPVLVGNDAYGRRVDGALDNVFFDTVPATPEQIVRLTCIPTPSTLLAVPAAGPQVPAGTPVAYDIQVTNNACDAQSFVFEAFSQVPQIFPSPTFDFTAALAPGETGHVALTVTSTTDAEPDDYVQPFFLFGNEVLNGSVIYTVQGGPCSVRSRKELSIRDVSVVDDPVRTAPGGAWTFGKLMEDMAPTPEGAPAMVETLLKSWLTDQNVNGFTVAARPLMQDIVLSTFPRLANGDLDLGHAPFRLLAIANRIDLNDVSKGSAGEGRFVFGVLDAFGNPLQFTMIVEYNIPAASAQEVTNLADAWHALSALPFPSEQYNTALQAVTDRFTKRDAAPGRPNGSALGQFRANDFFTLGEWEFREFHLSAQTGQMLPAPVSLTPDPQFNNTSTLADFINANEAAILQEKHTVPETFEGQPFQAGSMITNFFVWEAPGVNPEAREKFAINTCNGCHTTPLETGVNVFQVSPRSQGQESTLSPFLLGTQVVDSEAGVLRNFNELARRGRVLHDLICPDDPLPPPPPTTTPLGNTTDGGAGGRSGGGSGGMAGGGVAGTAGAGGGAGAADGAGGSTTTATDAGTKN